MTMTAAATARPLSMTPVAGLTLALAVGLPVAAILTAGQRDVAVQPGLIDWVFVGAVAVFTVATFGVLAAALRRRPGLVGGRLGLVLGGVALVLSPVAFWTMVPVVLGAAGAWLGHLARTAPGAGSIRPVVTIVVGLVPVVACVAAYVATS